MGVEADEDRGQTDERVHRGDQLRHLGHLHAVGDMVADGAAGRDQDERHEPEAGPGPISVATTARPCRDAVPDRALGAFLARQAAQREDEEDSRDDVGGGGESEFHCPCPLRFLEHGEHAPGHEEAAEDVDPGHEDRRLPGS
jgi:hypothetical protein